MHKHLKNLVQYFVFLKVPELFTKATMLRTSKILKCTNIFQNIYNCTDILQTKFKESLILKLFSTPNKSSKKYQNKFVQKLWLLQSTKTFHNLLNYKWFKYQMIKVPKFLQIVVEIIKIKKNLKAPKNYSIFV